MNTVRAIHLYRQMDDLLFILMNANVHKEIVQVPIHCFVIHACMLKVFVRLMCAVLASRTSSLIHFIRGPCVQRNKPERNVAQHILSFIRCD